MHSLRRLPFFDKRQVPVTERPPVVSANPCGGGRGSPGPSQGAGGLPECEFTHFAGGSGLAAHWLGSDDGHVRQLTAAYELSTFRAFQWKLAGLAIVDGHRSERTLLVALGYDAPAQVSSSRVRRHDASAGLSFPLVRVFDVSKLGWEGAPPTANEFAVAAAAPQAAEAPEGQGRPQVTAVAANAGGTLLAVGTKQLGVFVWIGDLLEEAAKFHRLHLSVASVAGPPCPLWVSALHLVARRPAAAPTNSKAADAVLFVCTASSIASFLINGSQAAATLLFAETRSGAEPRRSAVAPDTGRLCVLREGGIFAYDADEGRLSAIPVEGKAILLAAHGGYLVAVTEETGPTGEAPERQPGRGGRQLVSVLLAYPSLRLVAFSAFMSFVCHVFSLHDCLCILCGNSGGGVAKCLFELKAKPITERLNLLIRKRLFDWAAELSIKEAQPMAVTQEVYRLHGDWLYEKKTFDQALQFYIKTIGHLEASLVVEKYLECQRISDLSVYLEHLHARGLAVKEHTVLLFKCFTKLKDVTKLQTFLETTAATAATGGGYSPPSLLPDCRQESAAARGDAARTSGVLPTYDLAGAIEECRDSGYARLAADIARRQGYHQLYVAILLDDFKDADRGLAHIQSLPAHEACPILLAVGRDLMVARPKKVIKLIQSIVKHSGASLEAFLPLFVHRPERLCCLLDEGLASAEGKGQRFAALGPTVVITFLELLLRTHGPHRLLTAAKFREEAARAPPNLPPASLPSLR
eukprot:GHVT01087860.1.p1 GENE.GHVT01087860.1~~GHVT01087860.1.p1  ORF type:complete len:751 (+),score=193.58 GHVT01087860.1:297-2549(+)